MKNTNSLLNLNTQNAYTHIGFISEERISYSKACYAMSLISTYHNVNLSGVYTVWSVLFEFNLTKIALKE